MFALGVGDGRAGDARAGSTRSSCGCATSRRSTPRAARRSARATSVACLREGAERFGWDGRDPPGRGARALADRHRRRRVDLPGAAPAGAGARRASRTATFVVGHRRGRHRHGRADRAHPDRRRGARRRARARAGARSATARCRPAPVAGGSAGTASWGSRRARRLPRAARAEAGGEPVEATVRHRRRHRGARREHARAHAFGAQFAEVRVDRDTGEVRVSRLLGVFAAGRIVNPKHRPLAVHRRHDHGPGDGAARGERHRPGSATTSTTTSPGTTSPVQRRRRRRSRRTGSRRRTRT